MKIIADRFIPFLQGRLEGIADINYIDPAEFTPDVVRDADALLIRTRTRCDARLLAGSRVRFIATCTIGMDQFDLPWCASAGITTANAPGCNAPGVAQYVWSALLRAGMIPGRHRIGVIGYGNVGRIVAEWGEAMGFEMMLNDPPLSESSALPAKIHGRFVDLDRLLSECDAVTFHTPLTTSGAYPTRHLFSEDKVGLLPRGGIIVNAARGPVTSTAALLQAHRERDTKLIIDTWEGEPHLSRELLDASLFGTFHIAGYSLQGKQRATRMAVEALCSHFSLPIPDMSDLAAPYRPGCAVTAEGILCSYDPFADTEALRQAPDSFEAMRDHYTFRSEPSFVDCNIQNTQSC